MKILETKITGLLVFDGLRFNDNRGALIKPYSEKFLIDRDVNLNFKETWFTLSHKNVIRAMHLQHGDNPCEKLVSVINGCVIDVVLDLRQQSPTYGQYVETELNSENQKSIYIPIGCAHGYRVVDENTITMYMGTKVHSEHDDIGVRWDSFGYNWNVDNPILSDRDKDLPEFSKVKL